VGKKAAEILDEMERRYEAGDKDAKPDIITYTIAMKSFLQAGEAESLLDRMEKSDTPPDVVTYNEMIIYWSNVGTIESAERCERILEDMKHLAATKRPALKPNCYSYGIAINAWANSGDSIACERMWRLYSQMKVDNVEPDFATYNALIRSLSVSKERAMLQRADSLLQYMEESNCPSFELNHAVYNPIIKGYLSMDDVENATRVLLRFTKAPEKPSAVIMDIVMQGWLKAGDLEGATSLVDKMQELKDAKLLPVGPDSGTYRYLIGAWRRSTNPEREENIRKLKDRLEALNKRTRPSSA
jgi:hypothetical protein